MAQEAAALAGIPKKYKLMASSPHIYKRFILPSGKVVEVRRIEQRRNAVVLLEAIELLGKDVAMIHFKDFLRHDADGQLKACGAGQGEMEDYSTILRFAKQEKPFVFATLENTTPENAVACREFLQKQYDNC